MSHQLDTSALKPTSTMRDVHDWCVKNGVASLAQGMIELPPPETLLRLAANLMGGSANHTYRVRRGEPEYVAGLVNLLGSVYDTHVPPEAVMATSGVTGAIFASMQYAVRTKKVTKIGLTNPFYTYHQKHIELATGLLPVFVELNCSSGKFEFDWAALQQHLDNGLGALLVTNPGNPSAVVYSKEVLTRLVEMTGAVGCVLILDEVYCDLVWHGSFYSPVQDKLHPHVISCRGFSKNLATQSWRVGYIVSHPDTVSAVLAQHDPMYISVPILQHAVGQYLAHHIDEFKAHVAKLRDMMRANVAAFGEALPRVLGWEMLPPDGSMYVMFRHSEATDFEAVLKGIKCGIAVAAGSMFFNGCPAHTGFIRIHVGLSEERVKKIIAGLHASH